MTVASSDLVFYGAANQSLDDDDAVGGAIDTTVRILDGLILNSREKLEVISDSASDVQEVTIRGRSYNGYRVDETLTLNGTTLVEGLVEFYRIVDIHLASAAVGTISVRQQSDNTVLQAIAATLTRYTTLFKFGYARDGYQVVRYDKLFCKNEANSDLSAAVAAFTDQSRRLRIGPDPDVNDDISAADRLTAPSGVTFYPADAYFELPVDPEQGLENDDAIGLWIEQTVNALLLTDPVAAVDVQPDIYIMGATS